MSLKIYRTLDHRRSTARYAYVCASSKASVATILKTTVARLNHYGCTPLDANDARLARFEHLKEGDVFFEDPQNNPGKHGISYLDLHRIAALGYIDSAMQALNNCDMPDNEMSKRLGQIRADLKELKDDAKEILERRYAGR